MIPSESQIQKSFFEWLSYYPQWRGLTFAVPNGGFRSAREAKRLKLEGVTPGVPDIFMAIPSKGFHGLFIEFKKPKGKLTPVQIEMNSQLKDKGYCTLVCYGFEEAKKKVEDYLAD